MLTLPQHQAKETILADECAVLHELRRHFSVPKTVTRLTVPIIQSALENFKKAYPQAESTGHPLIIRGNRAAVLAELKRILIAVEPGSATEEGDETENGLPGGMPEAMPC